MIRRTRRWTRNVAATLLAVTLLAGAFVVGATLAQATLRSGGDELALHGEIAFWNGGSATVRNGGWNAVVEPGGGFDLLLTAPLGSELAPVREYDGVDCLFSSARDSRYLPIFFLEVEPPGEPALPLHLQSARFDREPGQAVAEFHYYSEATTVFGSCTIEYDDGAVAVYEFPAVEVGAGWNVLTATVVEVAGATVTYRIGNAGPGAALRWEVDAPALEPGDPYTGIGVTIGHHEAGLEVIAVLPGGPADRAGLREGDVVTRIDGVPTSDMNVGAAILHVTGPEGEAVPLDILRGGERFEFEVVRAILTVPEDRRRAPLPPVDSGVTLRQRSLLHGRDRAEASGSRRASTRGGTRP